MVVFSHGGDVEKLRDYIASIGLKLGETEERLIREDPERLILWLDNDLIVGHAIWHSSNTKQHPDGEPREFDDRNILEKELKIVGDFVELHEIWLSDSYRGLGYGSKFFDYFESIVKDMGYKAIVYYADHPAALKICTQRGYRQAFGVELDGIRGVKTKYYVFAKKLVD